MRRRSFYLMTPDALARTHAAAFDTLRPWTSIEFASLLESPHVFCVGDERCFALGRVVLDEVELLTLATAPIYRRQGLARARLQEFCTIAVQRGAAQAFLEVDATNHAAKALYLKVGFHATGHRKAYYATQDGRHVDATLMHLKLT